MKLPDKICIDDTSLDEDGIYMASESGRYLNIDVEYTRSDLVPQWLPIETAPKDGTTVLVCLPRQMNLIVRAYYSTVHKYWRTDIETDGGITNPTFIHKGDYWMPLPTPPRKQLK